MSFQLMHALRLRPWCEPPLYTLGMDKPPDWLTNQPAIDDWHRSKLIAGQLEQALQERRKAQREARSNGASNQPPPVV
jgi:hypothetical protein